VAYGVRGSRAGRPQFDTSGHGIIITEYEKVRAPCSRLVCSVSIGLTLFLAQPVSRPAVATAADRVAVCQGPT
jgi:hypothetical protein